MITNHNTVYSLTESVACEDTTILSIPVDKVESFFDAHETQSGHYEDYDISHWGNERGTEIVGLDEHTGTVAPTEVQ